MITSDNLERLNDLGLLNEFSNNELTILKLSYYLKIPFSKVEKVLYSKGFPKAITYTTLADSEWLPIILRLKAKKRRKRIIKKTKTRKSDISSKLKKKIPIRNWMNKKVGLKNQSEVKQEKPIIISIPMGGKVK
jgi:hypothetical protein